MTQSEKLTKKIVESLRPAIHRILERELKRPINEWKEYQTKPADMEDPAYQRCYRAAKKCKSETEFAIEYPAEHKTAAFHKWMKTFTWFKDEKPVEEWTKAECAKESKKYTSEYDFAVGSNNAYQAAVHNGWLDQFYWLNEYIEDDDY